MTTKLAALRVLCQSDGVSFDHELDWSWSTARTFLFAPLKPNNRGGPSGLPIGSDRSLAAREFSIPLRFFHPFPADESLPAFKKPAAIISSLTASLFPNRSR